ncbi:hypothetical protein WN55_06606 [Dufourea novaeangliae]|nr:hypothetical protein WN55_06606 [Dufourea novaeangliae]
MIVLDKYKKVFMALKAKKKEVNAEKLITYILKLHDRSGTHLFGKYILVGFGKEASTRLDDSSHKPEKVTRTYVNCFSYNDDYFAHVPLGSLH